MLSSRTSEPDSYSTRTMIAESHRASQPEHLRVGLPQPRVIERWLCQALDRQGVIDPHERRAMLTDLYDRLECGEPLQYVLGTWQFRWIELRVDRRALIPRPETELMVEWILAELAGRESPRVLELGTGTGAIGAALAHELPSVSVVATDVSADALALAQDNIVNLRLNRCIDLRQGSWWEAVEEHERFDLICSNPPYIADTEWNSLDPMVRDWEPRRALTAGPTGLECYEVIFHEARGRLGGQQGAVVLEIGSSQGFNVRRLAIDAGFDDVVIHKDLAGRDRFLVARFR